MCEPVWQKRRWPFHVSILWADIINGKFYFDFFRDKFIENVNFVVKEKMKSQSRGLDDADVVKAVGAISIENKLVEYHRLCLGMQAKTKQHAHDMIGEERVKVMTERIDQVDPFSTSRQKVLDFIVTPKGSPFSGMDKEQLDRFMKRQWSNYQRNFPSWNSV